MANYIGKGSDSLIGQLVNISGNNSTTSKEKAAAVGESMGKFIAKYMDGALVAQSTKAVALGLTAASLACFKILPIRNLELINVEYSIFNLMQDEIINNYVLKNKRVDIEMVRNMDTTTNTFSLNVISNTMLIKLLEQYVKNGGLFSLVTPIGIISNLALERLSASMEKANPIFSFSFIQISNNSGFTKNGKTSARNILCL